MQTISIYKNVFISDFMVSLWEKMNFNPYSNNTLHDEILKLLTSSFNKAEVTNPFEDVSEFNLLNCDPCGYDKDSMTIDTKKFLADVRVILSRQDLSLESANKIINKIITLLINSEINTGGNDSVLLNSKVIIDEHFKNSLKIEVFKNVLRQLKPFKRFNEQIIIYENRLETLKNKGIL